MRSAQPRRGRRLLIRSTLVLIAVVSLVSAWACPRAGHFLILDTVSGPADVIVVLAGTRAERWLEAVDLYKENFAPRILLSAGRIELAEEQLRQRGIAFPREVDLARAAMLQLGVPSGSIEIIPPGLDNTAEEAAAARRIASERGWRRLIVVTSKYHTRRSRLAFGRAFRGTDVVIEVRGSRHDVAHPVEWWKHRADLRFVIWELQKLLAYRLGFEG